MAALVGRFGDPEPAEECVQDAFAEAVVRWARDGVPQSPVAWLVHVASNRARDRLRRRGVADRGLRDLARITPDHAQPGDDDPPAAGEAHVPDERLRLMFMYCHPTLSLEAQVPLTLRLVGGLGVGEIARALMRDERAVAQRLCAPSARSGMRGSRSRCRPTICWPIAWRVCCTWWTPSSPRGTRRRPATA